MKGALASNWVVETFENAADGFTLKGSSKGYTSFSRAFNDGDKVFYAAHTDDGHREAGWAVVQGGKLVDRTPTATLTPQNVYTEGSPSPLAFQGKGTIACTFNAVAFDTIWDHVFREDNPHNVTAPQVDLEPVLAPLGPDEQNVQDALEFLYSYFSENSGGDWHITHIDGNYVYIEIKHGPRAEFPPSPADLQLAELKINHDDGQLWTRLADNTIVKIGDKDLITEAPLDGQLYGRKVSDNDPTVGDWFRISLASVQDLPPDDPKNGDLWVDTGTTAELYAYIGGSGWISMTGGGSGGGGGIPDNITLDDVDGTLYDKLLGREISENGSALWRPIYSSDVIPADGASPMTRADGSELRTQADINKFLYANLGGGASNVVVSDIEPVDPANGDLWFNSDPDVMALFVWYEDAQRWEPCKPDGADGADLGDLLWDEIDTGSNQNPVLSLQITHPTRPTQGGTEGLLHLWHGDPADCTTNPLQEFKVWMQDGGASIVDKFADDGIHPWFEIRQGNKSMRMKGISGGWTTDVKTYHVSCEDITGDVLSDGPCEMWIRYDDSPILDILDERYVNREGGDEMQGPFVIKNNPDNSNSSRENRRLTVLDIKSGTDQSSLNLGALNTSVYIGANQTTFAKPIHVNDVQEKDDGKGVTFASTIKFDSVVDTVLEISPEVGETQEISLFGNGQDKILKVDIQGATYKNAIEFVSGPSADRDVIFRIDSNRGIRAKNLNAWDTNIRDVADPVNDKDAVNLRSVQDAVGDLETRIRERLDDLIVETTSGQMKWQVVQHPLSAGTFTTYDRNNSTTYNIADTHDLQVNNTNLSGYDFNWGRLEPGMYLYMSGPLGLLVRFRVVSDPVDNGSWTSIKVADGFVSPDTYAWFANDEFDVAFRTFTGGSTDLDEYLPIDGSKTMTGPLQADTKVTAKVNADGNHFETAVLISEGYRTGATADAARITLSNGYNANSYATINYKGTSGSNGVLEFDRAKVEFKRLGNNKDGFVLRGRTGAGGTWGNNNALLSVYHNQGTGANADAVNYYGKQDGGANLATVGFVSSLFGDDTVVTPYGPLEPIGNGRVPAAGQISFGSTKPSETASIAISKTDKDGNTNDYHYGIDSIFSVVVDGVIVSGDEEFPMKQLVSVRVDGVEDKGTYLVLTVDGRDVHCKQRDEITGQYYYAMDPLVWYYAYTDTVTPMQKVPASLDEMFQFRDETAVFPEYLKYRLSTASGDGLTGAATGRLYMQGSLTAPGALRMCVRDVYGYGYLGKPDKSTASFTINAPGELTMFARSKWSKAIVPVEGYYFDRLYINQNKEHITLQNWDRSWKNTNHDWSSDEEVLVKFDFMAKDHTTRMLEQELEEMKVRLAKLEGK